MDTKLAARNWADDEEYEDPSALPKDSTTINKDGTKTVITYSINDAGKKVKTTRRIRTTIIREKVNPRVAERREWAKFGLEKSHPPGPHSDTTSIGENILFKPSITWKKDGTDEIKKAEDESIKDKLRDKKVKCRICEGEHFTARCPFKDSMAPAGGDEGLGDGIGAAAGDTDAGKIGSGSGGYVPPHLRKGGGAGGGDRMGGGGGKFERDDLATLRVTNVSEFAEEGDLRDMFERFGRVTRVFLAKDRETGRAKGFAFISYADRGDAQRAADRMDGYGYGHLILRVEFAKRS